MADCKSIQFASTPMKVTRRCIDPLVYACQLWVFAMCPPLRGSTVSYARFALFPNHAPVTRGRMRTQFPLPHGPSRAWSTFLTYGVSQKKSNNSDVHLHYCLKSAVVPPLRVDKPHVVPARPPQGVLPLNTLLFAALLKQYKKMNGAPQGLHKPLCESCPIKGGMLRLTRRLVNES